MRKILIAATAAVLATGAGLFGASAADKLKIGFIYLGPVGDLGWTYQHDLGRLEMVKEFGDKVETTFLENVSEGPDFRTLDRAARARRQQADLHDVVRLHGADAEGRQEIPERAFRARHRLQARQEHVDLFRPLL